MGDAAMSIDLYEKDHRARRYAQSAVSEVMDEIDDIEILARRDVYEAALRSACLAVHRVLEGDAELHYLRVERDHYKALAEKFIHLTPLPQILLVPGT